MTVTKARSRLQKTEEKKFSGFSHLKKERIDNKKLKILAQKLKIKEHFQYSFVLLLSLICFYLLYLLCRNFYPEQIQNFIIKNSYSAFFIPFFISNFLFFTFIFLNKKIGLLVAFFLSFSLYLKFLNVEINIFSIAITLLINTVLAFLLFSNFSRNKE